MTNQIVTLRACSQLHSYIIDNVGANIHQDAVDARVISDYINSTGGHVTHENQVGGWPTLAAGTPYTDSDHDGMADNWETANGLNPNDASDGNADSNNEGYLNLEAFLHYLTEKQKIGLS